MAFENISKGEFTAKGNSLMISGKTGQQAIFCRQDFNPKCKIDVEMLENTQFAAFCFNLQQRYDISKLEESVDMLSGLHLLLKDSNNGTLKAIDEQIEQLLKEIKK